MELSAVGGGRILCHGISWDPQESMELCAVWCVQCGIMEMHVLEAGI